MQDYIETILDILVPLLTLFGGWILGKRKRELGEDETWANSHRILSESRLLIKEGEGESIDNMMQVLESWERLFNATRIQVEDLRTEQKQIKRDYRKMEKTLKEYKQGTNILIAQISRLGYMPEWYPTTPAEDGKHDD